MLWLKANYVLLRLVRGNLLDLLADSSIERPLRRKSCDGDRSLNAKDRGKRGGRPAKLKPKDVRIVKQLLKDKTVTKGDIAMRFGVSRATVHRELLKNRKDQEAKELDKLLKARKRADRAGT